MFFIRAFSYASVGRLKDNETNTIRDLTGHAIKRGTTDKKLTKKFKRIYESSNNICKIVLQIGELKTKSNPNCY